MGGCPRRRGERLLGKPLLASRFSPLFFDFDIFVFGRMADDYRIEDRYLDLTRIRAIRIPYTYTLILNPLS